ncbi:MAG: AraC family transcriptional regulator [Polyangiales bacterium]|nr:AraC family transcriptional regulator [Myxococcales bacterium]MCB9657481.1 AraC family transcriptional regulator [Sandaracinaceae bacterium]
MLDPLSDVLSTLRMRGALYFRAALGEPWGLSVPANVGVTRFHILVRGAAFVDTASARVAMAPGDLLLVPHGATHALRSRPTEPVVPVQDVLDELAFDGVTDLVHGGDGDTTLLVCGHFAFDDELLHPVLDVLPSLLHVPAAEGGGFGWIDAATRAVGHEMADRRPGWQAIVDRVTGVLFIHALRSALERPDAHPVIAAFADPSLGRALYAIHEAPANAWTLETLGRRAGMSRTLFAERFRAQMGMPPMAYLTRWRLQRARRDLLDSGDVVAAVAERVGYASEAAFNRAFQRAYGKPPATYRRHHEDAARARTANAASR